MAKLSFYLVLASVFSSRTVNTVFSNATSNQDAIEVFDAVRSHNTFGIINVLARRTLAQRLDIATSYNLYFNIHLLDDLKMTLHDGNFKNLIVAMMTPTTEYYAQEINNAIIDEKSLIEIFITLCNDQMKETNKHYYNTYNKTVEDALTETTTGFFRDFLLSLSRAERSEDLITNKSAATNDADALYLSANKRFATFGDIFSHRSFNQLHLKFQEYAYRHGESIKTVIRNYFSGQIKDGFLAVVERAENKAAYFAHRFYDSMRGSVTRDSALIRLAVTRSEIDIENIKEEYRDLYWTSLADAIIYKTSGDYLQCLLILIGER